MANTTNAKDISSCGDYNQFAWLYNEVWGHVGSEVFGVMNRVADGEIREKAKVLDLCCGTGQLARVLSNRGFDVTGLDGSAEMLRFARKNAPQAEFILDDARSFQLPAAFKAVFSTFDSLNHMMSLRDLKAAFRNVYHCLVKGGLFLFDLNTEKAYKTQWAGYMDVAEKPDYLYVNRAYYDAKRRLGQTHCVIFRRVDDHWQRSDVRLDQKYYSVARVRSLLQTVGFDQIRKYGIKGKRYHEFTEEDTRVLFVCRKP